MGRKTSEGSSHHVRHPGHMLSPDSSLGTLITWLRA